MSTTLPQQITITLRVDHSFNTFVVINFIYKTFIVIIFFNLYIILYYLSLQTDILQLYIFFTIFE